MRLAFGDASSDRCPGNHISDVLRYDGGKQLGGGSSATVDEARLLYVSMTRAIEVLVLRCVADQCLRGE